MDTVLSGINVDINLATYEIAKIQLASFFQSIENNTKFYEELLATMKSVDIRLQAIEQHFKNE